MVQKLSYTANSITLGTGTSKVVLGADSGNLIVKDSDANTSIIEPGSGIIGGSAVTTYANPAALPFSPISSAGSLAYTTSTGALYLSNGSGWYKVTLINTAPSVTLSSTTASPTATNLTLDFTYTITEPEGTPTTVTLANSGIATTGNVAITHTTSNNHIRMVFDGSTEYAGDATVTLSVSDGVNTGTGTITVFTSYYDGLNTRYNTLLLKATGTGNNDTFDDASTSNHTITKNGDVPQLSFSPFREPGYAVDFAGEWTKIKDATFTFGTGDYTIEGWIYPHGTGNCDVIDLRSSSMNQGVALTLKSGNKIWPYYGGSQFTTGNIAIKQDEWSHIALVRTNGTLKAFVNGLQDFSVSDTQNRNGTSVADHGIGANYSGASKFDGLLYDWRVTTNAVYTSDFVPPTEPLTAISGTVLHVCRGPRIADYSSNAYVLEGQGGNNSPSQIAVTPYDRTNKYSTSDHVGSVYFDGTSGNWLSVADSDDLNVGTGDFTLECWIKPEPGGTGGYGGIFGSYAYDNNMLQMQISNTGTLRFVRPSGALGAGSTNMWSKNGDWHHIAMCRSGTALRGFVDGKQEIYGTYSNSIDWGHNTNGAVVGITDRTSYPTNYLYKGYISNLRLVKGTALYTSNFTPSTSPLTAITNTKLLLNMADSKVFDASQSTELLNLNGAVASSAQQHFSQNTIAFDGTNDTITLDVDDGYGLGPVNTGHYFELSENGGAHDFTIEGWIYKTSTTKDAWFSQRNSDSVELTIMLDATASGYSAGDLLIEYDSAQIEFDAGIVQNQWQHIAFQRNKKHISWYTDGVLKDNRNQPVDLVKIDDEVYIGGWRENNSYYGGYMHDFRFSNGISRFPYYAKPVTLTTTNSGMTKPNGTTPTVTASNVTLLCCHTGTAGSTTITDGSSNNTTITTNGNAVVSNFAPASGMKSVKFDGSGDYLQCTLADTLGQNDWTIEYWVYHNNVDDNDIHCAFGTFAPAFYYRNGSNAFAVYHNPGISGNHNANFSPKAHTWYHMAYVHDTSENKLTVFADGSVVDEFTYTGTINSTTFRIGDDTSSAWMDGYISNLRIVKDTVLYSKNFTPVTASLQ